MGLVTRVFGEGALEDQIAGLIDRLRSAAPLAAMKSNLALEIERHIRLIGTHDRSEAFNAFAQKRKPKFEGY